MPFNIEDCEQFVIKNPSLDGLEDWKKTLYRDCDGVLYIPAFPSISESMERVFQSFLEKNNGLFLIDDNNHVYVSSNDVSEIFPNRAEMVANAKKIIEEFKPYRGGKFH